MAPHPVQGSAGRPGSAGPARANVHPAGRAHHAPAPASKARGAGPGGRAGPAARPATAVAGQAAGRRLGRPAVRKESR